MANRVAADREWLLSELDRGADFPDPDQNLGAQRGRRRVAAAVLGHQLLDRFLQAVFAQAGPALVEVLAQSRSPSSPSI